MSDICGWMYTNWLLSDDYELMTTNVDQFVYEAVVDYMLGMRHSISVYVRKDADGQTT